MFIIMESINDNTDTLYKNTSKFTEDYNYLKLHNFELITKEILLRDDCDCLFYNTNLIHKFDSNWNKKEFSEILITDEKKQDSNIKQLLPAIYKNLLSNNVITQKDINVLNKWITYF